VLFAAAMALLLVGVGSEGIADDTFWIQRLTKAKKSRQTRKTSATVSHKQDLTGARLSVLARKNVTIRDQ
jgi:hypothetical protein